MITALVLLLQIAGAVFLLAAGVGILRFTDPLQRMHASTKAGTLGAGFTVLAAMVSLGTLNAVLIGLASLVFLLLSVPIAGHLLGRAIYVSGADLGMDESRDALNGELEREELSLDERIAKAPLRDGERASG